MTEQDKRKVFDLHGRGATYKQIEEQTGISAGTVRTFISRQSAAKLSANQGRCEECFCLIEQSAEGKIRRFCSARCRVSWWNKHRNELNSSSKHKKKCPVCGKKFVTYKGGTFCSRVCYIASFRKEAADRG